MNAWSSEIKKAAEILTDAQHVVSFCGAGVSEESGISTFRDSGGLWDHIDPWEAGTPAGLISAIEKKSNVLMPLFLDIVNSFRAADPNPGHLALASLESMGKMTMVITQNIDNLHHEAGNRNILEVHGNLFKMKCLSCSATKKMNRRLFLDELKSRLRSFKTLSMNSLIDVAPKCDWCGNVMRPDVVMFGEAVQNLPESFQKVRNCDAMLVLGTSGAVYPVAEFPVQAKNNGASIIVVNPTENAFSSVSDLYIPLKTGIALPEIVKQFNELTNQ